MKRERLAALIRALLAVRDAEPHQLAQAVAEATRARAAVEAQS